MRDESVEVLDWIGGSERFVERPVDAQRGEGERLRKALTQARSSARMRLGERIGQSLEEIYGSQLMTSEERTVYRNKMRAAKTQAERHQIRAEHHAAMQARAKERGVTLPEQPPAKGGRGPRGGEGA